MYFILSFSAMATTCTHLDMVNKELPQNDSYVCETCIKEGSTWVHLRACQTCGYIGCCDSSERTHARKHFEQTKHPIIESHEPNEDWLWCYIDDMYV
jgi:uncharacterized UBP type Zn finger protein